MQRTHADILTDLLDLVSGHEDEYPDELVNSLRLAVNCLSDKLGPRPVTDEEQTRLLRFITERTERLMNTSRRESLATLDLISGIGVFPNYQAVSHGYAGPVYVVLWRIGPEYAELMIEVDGSIRSLMPDVFAAQEAAMYSSPEDDRRLLTLSLYKSNDPGAHYELTYEEITRRFADSRYAGWVTHEDGTGFDTALRAFITSDTGLFSTFVEEPGLFPTLWRVYQDVITSP